MELEVRVVGDIEDCFVRLPLHLIQILQSNLSSLVSLELRSPNHPHPWFVAWSGATSSSSSIEIARQFADSISLPDRTLVQVRVVSDVPKATLVTVEPLTEDDWEVLELNSEHASQDPSSRNAISFVAPSSLSQLSLKTPSCIPGTEVAVGPKRQKNNAKNGESFMQSSNDGNNVKKALLLLLDSDKQLLHKYYVQGLKLGVAFTSVALLSLETAKNASLNSLQLVTTVPRLSSK